MKNYKVIAICLALVMGLAAAVFAVNNYATRNVAAKTAMSCCADAACCAGGTCKMNGACCSNHGAKAAENHTAYAVKASGVKIENASDETAASCHHDKAQTATGKKDDCCDNGGSACCKTGAACCDTKKQTARL